MENDEIRILRGSTELVVIDEAHTAVTWGETFRDAYRKLPEIIRAISPLIVLAFTATADNRIGKGILNGVFSGRNVHIVHSSPDRENIFYRAIYPLSKDKEARRMLQDPESRPAVIFLRSRILAERIASALSDEFPAACYHAGLPAEERREKEECLCRWGSCCDMRLWNGGRQKEHTNDNPLGMPGGCSLIPAGIRTRRKRWAPSSLLHIPFIPG